MRVIYADTDMMGRVYYSRYLEYFEASRSHMLREIGLPYSQMEKRGVLLPVVESHCVYTGSATFENVLTIRLRVKDMPRSTIRIDYEVYREGEPATIVQGYTVHAFLTPSGKAVKPPKPFLEALKSHWVPSDDE